MRVRVPPAAQLNPALASYIVGAALGDGNLSNPNGRATRLRITCSKQYPAVANEIEASLKILFPDNKVSRVGRKTGCFDISVYSNKLEELIPWKASCGPKHIQKARVPAWIIGTKDLEVECLRGLIQTDGCIYYDRGYPMIHFTNVCEELAIDYAQMLVHLGFSPHSYLIATPTLPKYVVRLSKDVLAFSNLINLSKE